jgi:hypothetical protein
MPDFNAKADVYVAMMKEPRRWQSMPARRPIHSGTLAESISWTLANHDGYPDTYTIEVPLEAGFQTKVLHYRDIRAIAQRPDFPRLPS